MGLHNFTSQSTGLTDGLEKENVNMMLGFLAEESGVAFTEMERLEGAWKQSKGEMKGPSNIIITKMSYFFEMCTQEGQSLDPVYLPFHQVRGTGTNRGSASTRIGIDPRPETEPSQPQFHL